MTDFFNFHDTWYVVQYHWFWLLVALGLGVWVGWRESGKRPAGEERK
jgi:hypothetical protein